MWETGHVCAGVTYARGRCPPCSGPGGPGRHACHVNTPTLRCVTLLTTESRPTDGFSNLCRQTVLAVAAIQRRSPCTPLKPRTPSSPIPPYPNPLHLERSARHPYYQAVAEPTASKPGPRTSPPSPYTLPAPTPPHLERPYRRLPDVLLGVPQREPHRVYELLHMHVEDGGGRLGRLRQHQQRSQAARLGGPGLVRVTPQQRAPDLRRCN